MQDIQTDYIPVPAYSLDANQRIVAVNERWLLLLGYRREEVLGRPIADFLTEASAGAILDAWPRFLTAGEILHLAMEFVAKGGKSIDVLLSARLLRDEAGHFVGTCSVLTDVTDRREAEAALRAVEDERRLVLEAAGLGTWTRDVRTDELILSPEARALLALEPDEPARLDEMTRRIHPDDRDRILRVTEQATRDGTVFDLDYRVAQRNGSYRWLRSKGRPVRDAAGNLVRLRGILLDVDQSKRDDLAKSTLAAIVRSSDAAIISKTLEGIVTSWNSGAERLFGYGEAEMIGQPIAILAPPNRPDEMKNILERVRNGERIEHFETERMAKDGRVLQVNLNVSPIYDENGRVVGASKILQDVSALKRAEANIRHNEAQLRSILETVPDAMVIIDEGGFIQSFSMAAERLFGWPAAEAQGQNVSILMPGPYRDAHDSYLMRYLKTNERHIIGIGRVVTGQRRDGTTFPMELSVGEVFVDGRRLFTGFVRDISERRMAEARLHELQSELVHVARLSEMGQMSSALAHEINQPLTAASAYLQASQRMLRALEPQPTKPLDVLQKAGDQIKRTSEIIRRLRDFAKKGDVARRTEDLAKVIEEANALGMIGARSLGVTMRLDLDPQARTAFIDRIQIQQVIVNLVRNAVEAMAGSARRELRVATIARDADFHEVVIADTGSGLEPSVAAQLFRPFVTTKESGMGIGLSICQSIIRAHGGEIGARPNPAGGTQFYFTVPARE